MLVSQATASITRDVDDIDFIDLGEHRLRDLLRPEHVFQVLIPGAQAAFPPLRSLNVSSTNLPVQLTTFIGRGDELSRICTALRENRAVTITGVGGVGKTRLALQVAGEICGEFAGGVWFCELASATDAESMVASVAATLGVQGRPGATIQDGIVEFFRPKEMLWVVDNCEHLLQPVAFLVDRVMRGARASRCSRRAERRDVDGERAIPLRSMTTASSDDVDSVSASDASRLFVERAAGAQSGLRFGHIERGRCEHDLSKTRRYTARYRARGRARGVNGSNRDRGAARRAIPASDGWPSHRDRTPPDPSGCGRMVVRASR